MASEASTEAEDQPEIVARVLSLPIMGSPRKAGCQNQLMVRNTFIDAPQGRALSLDGFYKERQVQSSPPSGNLEVATPTLLGHAFGHHRVMSAVKEALARDLAYDRTNHESSSSSADGPPTVTTAESTPEAPFATSCADGLAPLSDCVTGKVLADDPVQQLLLGLPVSEMENDYYCNAISGYPCDCSVMNVEQHLEERGKPYAFTPSAASTHINLSNMQCFTHATGTSSALSTELLVQAPLHSVNSRYEQPLPQPPAATLRREMLRARGAAVVEAAGWRPTGSPMSSASMNSSFHTEAHSRNLTTASPGTPPGNFWPAASLTAKLQLSQLPQPPPPPNPPEAPTIHRDGMEFQSMDLASDLPSRGSALHKLGTCKPCAFVFEGCNNGATCEFCHLCEPGERMRRKKEKMAARREETKRRTEKERIKG
jgi:hypothetical protein